MRVSMRGSGSCGWRWRSRWNLADLRLAVTASNRHFHAGAGLAENAVIAFLGEDQGVHLGRRAIHRRVGMSLLPSSTLPAARKWPMLVAQEPMKTSSILSPGDFGQQP